jgi:outer membrane protein assembly factor BamA
LHDDFRREEVGHALARASTELQVLLECVREGDTVIVTRIDRLARSMKDLQDIVITDSSALRSSVGTSLIWDSPVGPLCADYSYVLSKAASDKTQAFGFSYSGW